MNLRYIIEEGKKGWRDGLWSWYFGLYLLPWCLLASLIDTLFYRTRPGEQPGLIALIIAGVGAVHSLYKAKRRTGDITDEHVILVKTFISKWYNTILNKRKG